MIYKENRVFAICHTLPDMISIFGRVKDIYTGIISTRFGAILPQKMWVIKISLLLLMFTISKIINRNILKRKYQQQIYIQPAYL